MDIESMQKNKELHITYIGRLEQEKGIDILIDCIERSILEERNIIWHICGTGSFLKKLQSYNRPYIHIYGYTKREELDLLLKKTDLVLMPSLFLETFWLVALETLLRWVPVCWFSQWWLQDFIHPELALDKNNPLDSFFKILDAWNFSILDVSDFSYPSWKNKLSDLVQWHKKILLVNDYTSHIWWAEEYIFFLKKELENLGKEVKFYWYSKKINRYTRFFAMIITPIAFWRGIQLKKELYSFSPDLIWMHSVVRYIGPYGVAELSWYDCKKYITHHDLGLIVPQPSKIYSESDIPDSSGLGNWIPKKIDILSILFVLWKWLIITWIWNFLKRDNILHILPASWMNKHFSKYTANLLVFSHTSKIP